MKSGKHDICLTLHIIPTLFLLFGSQLIRYHIILPHTTIPNTYWFAVRRNGLFMSYLRKGRSEILRAIKKRMTKDMLEKVKIVI